MAQCSTTSLLSSANCFACLAADQLQMVIAALLCEILKAVSPMANCDVSSLLSSARCFAGCSSPAQLMLIQTQLLCEILHAEDSIVGGTGSVLCGAADPVNAPAGNCAVYYRTDTGSIWIWDGSAWVQRVA